MALPTSKEQRMHPRNSRRFSFGRSPSLKLIAAPTSILRRLSKIDRNKSDESLPTSLPRNGLARDSLHFHRDRLSRAATVGHKPDKKRPSKLFIMHRTLFSVAAAKVDILKQQLQVGRQSASNSIELRSAVTTIEEHKSSPTSVYSADLLSDAFHARGDSVLELQQARQALKAARNTLEASLEEIDLFLAELTAATRSQPWEKATTSMPSVRLGESTNSPNVTDAITATVNEMYMHPRSPPPTPTLAPPIPPRNPLRLVASSPGQSSSGAWLVDNETAAGLRSSRLLRHASQPGPRPRAHLRHAPSRQEYLVNMAARIGELDRDMKAFDEIYEPGDESTKKQGASGVKEWLKKLLN